MRLYKPKYLLLLAIPLLLTSIATSTYAQKTSAKAEKAEEATSATPQDSASIPKKKSSLTAPVKYTAKDSIVLYKAGNAYMYGEGSVQYENVELTADYIHLNADSTKIDAHGVLDADSALVGTPVFKENGEEYEARTIEYNYDTKKGFVRQAVVKQGDGYVVGKEAKKIGDDIFYMKNGHYTTCDNHEHPHFYLNLTKAKVKQKHWVATGPAYMVLMDVPLPLAVPFGFFRRRDEPRILPERGRILLRDKRLLRPRTDRRHLHQGQLGCERYIKIREEIQVQRTGQHQLQK